MVRKVIEYSALKGFKISNVEKLRDIQMPWKYLWISDPVVSIPLEKGVFFFNRALKAEAMLYNVSNIPSFTAKFLILLLIETVC